MDLLKEHLERDQDPIIEKLRQAALEVFQKYIPQYINNSKIELNLDKSKADITINMLIYNI